MFSGKAGPGSMLTGYVLFGFAAVLIKLARQHFVANRCARWRVAVKVHTQALCVAVKRRHDVVPGARGDRRARRGVPAR